VQLTHAQSETKRVTERYLQTLQEHTEALAGREAAESRVSAMEEQLHDMRVRGSDRGRSISHG
jgi:ribosomal protein S8E